MIQLTFFSGVPYPLRAFQEEDAIALQKWEESVGEVFGGFTKYQGIGYWRGTWEDSLTYVIVLSEVGIPHWESCVRHFKLKLAETLAQQEILVTWIQLGGLV